MTERDEPRTKVEGITFQYVGELLTGVSDTARLIRAAPSTYKRCLEDLVYAACFTHGLTTTSTIARGGTADKGAALIDELRPLGLVQTVDRPDATPESLLEDDAIRTTVALELQSLDRAVLGLHERYWLDWIGREAEQYFGEHDSLTQSGLSAYTFSKKPEYLRDAELQAAVPRTFRSRLGAEVLEKLNAKQRGSAAKLPCTDAVDDFVSRNALTLVVIAHWYDDLSPDHRGIYLPHITRATVLLSTRTGGQTQSTAAYKAKVVATKRIVVRHALADVLMDVDDRGDLLTVLKDRLDLPPYPALRARVSAVISELEDPTKRQAASLDKLRNDIRRLSLDRAVTAPVEVTLAVGGPLQASATIRGVTSLPFRRRRSLRHLVQQTSDDYRRALARIFPELVAERDANAGS